GNSVTPPQEKGTIGVPRSTSFSANPPRGTLTQSYVQKIAGLPTWTKMGTVMVGGPASLRPTRTRHLNGCGAAMTGSGYCIDSTQKSTQFGASSVDMSKNGER